MKQKLIAFTLSVSCLVCGMPFAFAAPPSNTNNPQTSVATQTSSSKKLTDKAVFKNFIAVDPLEGENGLPVSPAIDPTKYGPINIMLDVDGNANEATITGDVSYFNGKYYMYSQSFAYGGFDIAPGANMTATLPTVPNSFYRAGGLVIYESEDLMNWKLVGRYFPQDPETGRVYIPKKTRVIHSEKTGKYVMWFGNGQGSPYSGKWIMESDTPYGPWSEPRLPDNPLDPTHTNLGRDFDIGVDEKGEAWLVRSHGSIDVFLLNEEYTGIVECYETGADTSILNGGIGIHYENGWWYITGDHGGGNPIGSNFTYIMAKDPRGPWISPDTGSTEKPVTPSVLADDAGAGYAQPNGSSTVVDAKGNFRTFVMFKHYISSPQGAPKSDSFKQPGDANLALGGQWFYPLTYSDEGKILPMKVTSSSEFPLAKAVNTTVPDAYQAALTISNKQSIVQTWTEPSDSVIASVRPSVFQRTPDKGPEKATTQAPQEPDVNAPLEAELTLPNGKKHTWTLDARTIRWAPQQVALNLPEPVTGGGTFSLKLSTKATNGGYGVAVGPKLKNGKYKHVGIDGSVREFPNAGIMLRTFDTTASAPIIKKQPRSITVVSGEEIGFVVEAEGVGLGYQWYKDGKIILAPDGYNESDNIIFRRDNVTKADAGAYSVSIFNTTGKVASETVKLYVIDVTSEAALNETGPKAVITCSATNNESYPVDIEMVTQWGNETIKNVAPHTTVQKTFTADKKGLVLGDVQVKITAQIDGQARTAIHDAHYGRPLNVG